MSQQLVIWFEDDSKNTDANLYAIGDLVRDKFPGTEFETVEVNDAEDEGRLWSYCEWCMDEDRPRFYSTEEYTDHLREVHPDEAW